VEWKLNWTTPDNRQRAMDNFLLNAPFSFNLQDESGIVRINAESYTNNFSGGVRSWKKVSDSNAGGGFAMQADANMDTVISENISQTSPVMEYPVKFVKTGLHYLWVKGKGNTNDDAVHFAFDGDISPVTKGVHFNGATNYTWSNTYELGTAAVINVSSIGVHTISLYMKEDGVMVDSLLIRTSEDITPPSIPSNLIISGQLNNSLMLSWQASTDDVGVAGYEVYKDGQFYITTTDNPLKIQGLSAGIHYFSLKAFDLAGNKSELSTAIEVNTLSAGIHGRIITSENFDNAIIKVYDLYGRLLIQKINNSNVLSLEELSKGFYIIQVENGAYSGSMKLILQ
jgi:hypothetical protein